MIFLDSSAQQYAGKIINELVERHFNINRMRLVPGERGNCMVIEIMKANIVQELDQLLCKIETYHFLMNITVMDYR